MRAALGLHAFLRELAYDGFDREGLASGGRPASGIAVTGVTCAVMGTYTKTVRCNRGQSSHAVRIYGGFDLSDLYKVGTRGTGAPLDEEFRFAGGIVSPLQPDLLVIYRRGGELCWCSR